MKIIGIDPGTKSFDFFGKEGDETILDYSIPSPDVAAHPEIILDTVMREMPLDIVIGPSGYGLPLIKISDAEEEDLNLMLPVDYGDVSVNEGIKRVFRLMKDEKLPVWMTPGVIHLPTVPAYRKANKIDMGTADKVCCAALAIRDQAERLSVPFADTSFILLEVGYGFTAVLGIRHGQIVDGIGGTEGGPGFLCPGGMDAELAIRFGKKPQSVLFTGGARDAGGDSELTPELLAADPERYADSWSMLIEGIVKDIAQMMVSMPDAREILLSGRLTRISAICQELTGRLSRFATVRNVAREARIAKEAAEGACLLGEGLLGGRYAGIADCLRVRHSHGTMYDYITCKVAEDITGSSPCENEGKPL
ncbi:MAG: DUF1464 family protein [Candidatus Aureabacteria bacterium]|nr:DUF1464 family protein [Candidatus Auribacterota bacterium]